MNKTTTPDKLEQATNENDSLMSLKENEPMNETEILMKEKFLAMQPKKEDFKKVLLFIGFMVLLGLLIYAFVRYFKAADTMGLSDVLPLIEEI
ncbi:MAG TPA: hypothetical protein VNG53_12040 [Bacteroidia bacterium]|nr:hypothetical protein [Bacteroidia bacterium]